MCSRKKIDLLIRSKMTDGDCRQRVQLLNGTEMYVDDGKKRKERRENTDFGSEKLECRGNKLQP